MTDLKYRRIVRAMHEAVENGALRPHDRVPSLGTLVRQYGVSDITARRAVRELVREGWVYTVRGKGCFVADRPSGGALPSAQNTPRVAFLIAGFLNYFYGAILEGVLGVLRPRGYVIDLLTTLDRSEIVESALARLLREEVAGVLFMPAHADLTYYPVVQLAERGVPTVLVDRASERLSCDSVACDHAAGMRLAVRTLLHLGHRRVLLLGGNPRSDLSSVRARFTVYRTVLEDAGSFDPALIAPEDPSLRCKNSVEFGRVATARCLERNISFSAVIAMMDEQAAGAIEALHAAGRKVPRDVSVLCFDDSLLAQEAPVPLTVVRQPTHDIGRTAATMLLRRLRGWSGKPRRVLLRPDLIMRASVGRAPRWGRGTHTRRRR